METTNSEAIINILSNTYKGLQIIHLNARSLTMEKLDFLKYFLRNTCIDIVCITETWFKSQFNDSLYELLNFSCTRLDRQNGLRGGGIAIYCRKSLITKVRLKSSINNPIEFLGVEVQGSNNNKCLIIAVYNPSRNNNLEIFFEQLRNICLVYENIVVCGDFNIDILRNDLKAQQFTDNANACGLNIINQWPTRFAPNASPALLDVTMCSNLSRTVHYDQLSLAGISDHDMLFYVFGIDLNCKSNEKISYRDFKGIDNVSLFNECLNINWNCSWFSTSVDSKLELLTQNIQNLFDKHVPTKTLIIKASKPPWFRREVKLGINQRNKLYRKWKSNPSSDNWEIYRLCRNKVHVTTRKAKCAYYSKIFGSNLSNNDFWKKD